MSSNSLTVHLRTLTPLWTGGIDGTMDRIHETGLLGSLRWWYEVLVRGLGGVVCDPTGDGGCPSKDKKKNPTAPGHHCVVCELFGCTGWSRKFRFVVEHENRNPIIGRVEKDETLILRFIPLRPIRPEEWCLLDATLRLIDEYGAIGGRTVLKPSDEWGIADLGVNDLHASKGKVKVRRTRRGQSLQKGDVILEIEGSEITSLEDIERIVINKHHGEPLIVKVLRNNGEKEMEAWAGKRHHQDFGLIRIEKPLNAISSCTYEQLIYYVKQEHWRKNSPIKHQNKNYESEYAWASLKNFWCVKGRYLARQDEEKSTFNQVVGRKQDKSIKEKRGRQVIRWSDLLENPSDEISRWLAGRQQESKKVFSFKDPARTFGFIKPGLIGFEEMRSRLRGVWQNQGFNAGTEFKTGEQILNDLFQKGDKT